MEANQTEIAVYEHPQGGKKKAYIPDPDGEKERVRDVVTGGGDTVREQKNREALWMPFSKQLLEDAIIEGRIRLKANPVLVSAILSVALVGDDWDNQWFSKRTSTQRIDPVIALAMAMGLSYIKNLPSGKKKSYLADGPVIFG